MASSPHASRPSRVFSPSLMSLEGRRLLSSASGPVPARPVIPKAVSAGPVVEAMDQAGVDLRLPGMPGRFQGPSASIPAFNLGIVHSNLPYSAKSGPPRFLDVYVPRGPAPAGGWPVIVAIHGGGWRRYDKRDYGPRVASAFVPAGYAVVAPNYLLSGRNRPSWPIAFQDVQSAVVWIKVNAKTYDFDPARVIAMGESAGANLANLLGTESDESQADNPEAPTPSVWAVVGFSSPTDLAALKVSSPQAGRAVAQFLGGSPATVPQLYVAASPVDQVSRNSAPTLLIHGSADPLVPIMQSYKLAGALTSAGVRNRLIVIPGAGHTLNFPIGTPANLTFQILEFLDAT